MSTPAAAPSQPPATPAHPLPPSAAAPPAEPPAQPATPPAEPPKAEAEEVIHDPATDPTMLSLYRDLEIEFKDGEVTLLPPKPVIEKDDDAPPAKPAEPPPAAPPAAPAAAEPPKPPTPAPAPKIEAEVEEPLGTVVANAVNLALDARLPKPETPKAPEQPVDPDADYVSTLGPVSKSEVDLAAFAESHDPARYKNLRKQTIQFLKAVDEYKQQHEGEEGRTFDAQDDEWKKFVSQRRPKVTAEEKQLLKDEMIQKRAEERAYERARREFAPKIEEAQAKTKEITIRPKIEERVKAFEVEVLSADAGDNVALKEVLETARTKGAAAAQDVDPIYATIVNNNVATFAPVAAEFLAIANGLKTFNPEDKTHQWLYDFIETQGRHVAANPQYKIRTTADGRKQRFVTRSEYARLSKADPDKLAEVYTFKDQDILDILAVNTRNVIIGQAKQWQDKLTKAGYGRQKQAPAPPATPPPAPSPTPAPAAKSAKEENEESEESSPKVGGSPAPGAVPGNGIPEEKAFTDREWKLMMGED